MSKARRAEGGLTVDRNTHGHSPHYRLPEGSQDPAWSTGSGHPLGQGPSPLSQNSAPD